MSHVKVFCTIRPPLEEQDVDLCIESGMQPSDLIIKSNGSEIAFEMDGVYGGGCSQTEVFNSLVKPMIADALEGFNTTIFTYGQTGSGKTYCMQGPVMSIPDASTKGIVPRLMGDLFSHFDAVKDTTSASIRVSMVQIYQEKLYDLLCEPSKTPASLRIRELIGGQVWVEGLIESQVENIASFENLNSKMLKRRVVGSHSMNAESSRSHVCILVRVNQMDIKSGARILSKIHLIDLAGSEMIRKTDATGARLSEAKHINKSLSALGNVIYALTSPTVVGGGLNVSKTQPVGQSSTKRRIPKPTVMTASVEVNTLISPVPKVHIPYRDSKLTRLLQDSLGGNAKTALILALNPSKLHYQESMLTLRFGERARQLRTRPVRNSEPTETSLKKQLARAKQTIKSLQDTIAELLADPAVVMAVQHEIEDDEPAATPVVVGKGTGKGNCSVNNSKYERQLLCEKAIAQKGDVLEPISDKKTVPAAVAAVVDNKMETPAVIVASALCALCMKSLSAVESEQLTIPVEAECHSTASRSKSPLLVDLPVVSDVQEDESVVAEQLVNVSEVTARDIEDETMVRCGVCGLSSTEAEHLQRDIGEYLGEMFSCDGNCGNQFHAKCVGVVGEAGQYVAPEEDNDAASIIMESKSSEGLDVGNEDVCTSVHSTIQRSSSEEMGEDITVGKPPPSQLSTSNKLLDLEVIADNDSALPLDSSVGIPLRKRADTVCEDESIACASLASVAHNPIFIQTQLDYHQMRRERNKILAQWQHERKISQLLDKQRSFAKEQRDEEFVKLNHKVVLLEESLAVETNKLKAANIQVSSVGLHTGTSDVLQAPGDVEVGDCKDNILDKNSVCKDEKGCVPSSTIVEVPVEEHPDKNIVRRGGVTFTRKVDKSKPTGQPRDPPSAVHSEQSSRPSEQSSRPSEQSSQKHAPGGGSGVCSASNRSSHPIVQHAHVPAYVTVSSCTSKAIATPQMDGQINEGSLTLLRPMPKLSRKSASGSASVGAAT